MKLSTIWSAYLKAADRYEVADKNYLDSREALRSYYGRIASRCLKRRLHLSAYLTRRIAELEAAQAKAQAYIDKHKARQQGERANN